MRIRYSDKHLSIEAGTSFEIDILTRFNTINQPLEIKIDWTTDNSIRGFIIQKVEPISIKSPDKHHVFVEDNLNAKIHNS